MLVMVCIKSRNLTQIKRQNFSMGASLFNKWGSFNLDYS